MGLKLLLALALPAAIGWGALALWFDGPADCWLAGLSITGWVAVCLVLLITVRPAAYALVAVTLAFLVLLGWWFSIPPRNDRDWYPDVARLPAATVVGSQVTIHNLRNFDYRSETDYTERWETRTFDLERLRGIDMFISFWGPTLIAHTITSWEFADGSHLAISIETRKEKGESYSAVRGFFRQYELYYVVADERDVIRLRTNYRGERVYLYHLKVKPEFARALLLDYLAEINRLAEQPRWYNALSSNCTTVIQHHVRQVSPGYPWSWKILANGYLDELGYARGTIDTTLPFAELRQRSDITAKAQAADRGPAFSRQIRVGLPGQR
ncbi:MAG: DUF4105 domain-containing protein [Candidatus Competibacteraceae bacterium]